MNAKTVPLSLVLLLLLLVVALPVTAQDPPTLDPPTPINLPALSGETITAENWADVRAVRRFGQGVFYDLRFSPDGEQFVVGTGLGGWLYDWDEQAMLRFLEVATDNANVVAYSPDGSLMALGGRNGLIQIYDGTGTEAINSYFPAYNIITALAFSPDNSMLALGLWDGRVMVYDLGSNQRLFESQDFRFAPLAISFSADGSTLSYGSSDEKIILRDAETFALVESYDGPPSFVTTGIMTYNHTGSTLYYGDDNGSLTVYDIATGETRFLSEITTSAVMSVAVSDDGQMLAIGDFDGNITLMPSASDGSDIRVINNAHRDRVRDVALSPDGSRMVSTSLDGEMIAWDVASGERLAIHQGFMDWIDATAFSTDGRYVATSSFSSDILLWDLETQSLRWRFVLPGRERLIALAFQPGAPVLWAGLLNGALYAIDSDTGLILQETFYTTGIRAVDVAPDGEQLVIGGSDGAVLLYDTRTGENLGELGREGDRINHVRFSPDGQRVASGGEDRAVNVWNVKARSLEQRFDQPEGIIIGLYFSPSGDSLFVYDNDARYFSFALVENPRAEVWAAPMAQERGLYIWDSASNDVVGRMPTAHTANLTVVGMSRDGSMMLSGGLDGAVYVWAVPVPR